MRMVCEVNGLIFLKSISDKELADIYAPYVPEIIQPSTNKSDKRLIDAISDAMALLRGAHHIPDDRPAELYTEHKKIVDAIRSRDPEAAEQAAHEHIKNSYKTHLTTTGG